MSTSDPKLIEAMTRELDLDGLTVPQAIQYLADSADGWADSKISVDYGWDGEREHNLILYRYETPEEVEKRLVAEKRVREANRKRKAQQKKQQEADERATYQRLKDKYGE